MCGALRMTAFRSAFHSSRLSRLSRAFSTTTTSAAPSWIPSSAPSPSAHNADWSKPWKPWTKNAMTPRASSPMDELQRTIVRSAAHNDVPATYAALSSLERNATTDYPSADTYTQVLQMHRRMRQGDKALGLLVRMAEGGYLVPNNQHMRLALEACVKSISPVQTWRVFTRLWQHGVRLETDAYSLLLFHMTELPAGSLIPLSCLETMIEHRIARDATVYGHLIFQYAFIVRATHVKFESMPNIWSVLNSPRLPEQDLGPVPGFSFKTEYDPLEPTSIKLLRMCVAERISPTPFMLKYAAVSLESFLQTSPVLTDHFLSLCRDLVELAVRLTKDNERYATSKLVSRDSDELRDTVTRQLYNLVIEMVGSLDKKLVLDIIRHTTVLPHVLPKVVPMLMEARWPADQIHTTIRKSFDVCPNSKLTLTSSSVDNLIHTVLASPAYRPSVLLLAQPFADASYELVREAIGEEADMDGFERRFCQLSPKSKVIIVS